MACGVRLFRGGYRHASSRVPALSLFALDAVVLRGAMPTPACWCTNIRTMSIRIVPDDNQPSASIEIALEKSLPDYDLDEVEQPTPRHVDAVLVSQGFRDLVDDARGILMDLLAQPHPHHPGFDLSADSPLVLAQLTGAICPGNDEVYRPGLWIVLQDPKGKPKTALSSAARERVAAIATELAKRLQLD